MLCKDCRACCEAVSGQSTSFVLRTTLFCFVQQQHDVTRSKGGGAPGKGARCQAKVYKTSYFSRAKATACVGQYCSKDRGFGREMQDKVYILICTMLCFGSMHGKTVTIVLFRSSPFVMQVFSEDAGFDWKVGPDLNVK